MARLRWWLGKRRVAVVDAKPPQLDRKDIVAVIIALFQLFSPLVLGLLAVGVIVSIVLLNIK
jgi:hypothetical protein